MIDKHPPPIVLHVPHASTFIPPELREQFVLPEAELSRELELITDHYTDELFNVSEEVATTITFPVSRLLVDPERFEQDAEEPMSNRGMGVIYTHGTHRQPIRRELDNRERESLLETYYRTHHAKLTAAVDCALEANGTCLIVDAHSFPASPLPYELDQNPTRPGYCIGTDPYHTPMVLKEKVESFFSGSGNSVEINRPFGGALVPMKHYMQHAQVWSIMVEVNRSLYLSPPTTSHKSERFDETRNEAQQLVAMLSEWLPSVW